MHSESSVLVVKMSLNGSELRWRSKKIFSTKSYKLQLRDILSVEGGKQTTTFQRSSASQAKDEVCFSLVTASATYDFETSSKVERDALVQGFLLAITDLKEHSAV